MHADGPRAVGPHGKPVEASGGTTASDVGAMRPAACQAQTAGRPPHDAHLKTQKGRQVPCPIFLLKDSRPHFPL